MKYVPLILLWTLWCIVHSSTISLTSSAWFRTACGKYHQLSRLSYNLVALATLIPLLRYGHSVTGPVLFNWTGYAAPIRWLLLAAAATLFIAGGIKYDMLQFLGIRQIMSGQSQVTLSESGHIDTSGVLSVTRHPWYVATIFYIWAGQREINLSALISNSLVTIYVVVGTLLEERRLIGVFGDEYRDYMRRVSMLLPTRWVLSRLSMAHSRRSR
jgi:methanethiol S-methyltransferase